MQMEKMYDDLCSLYKQQKEIYVKMNGCCLKRDLKGWADSIDEFNHLNRKIAKQLDDMCVLREKNIEEQQRSLCKHFNLEVPK